MYVDHGKAYMNACLRLRNFLVSCFLILMIFFTTACSDKMAPAASSSESPIEKNMKEFYNKLGGKSILGEILSPVLTEDGFYYQFTEKTILVFDPQESTLKQYHLHPVGLDMGFQEPPEPMPADPDAVYVNGFVVWPEALDLFNRWGRICKPISALHYNEEYKRYEQYFDCFGIYRKEDEPVGVVHLLDYGAWYCGDACTTYSPSSSGFIPDQIFPEPPARQDLSAAEANIIIAADRIGRAITGFPLTPTYLSDDGSQYLKIYENVVFSVDRDNPARAYVLAITRSLNIRSGTPKAEIIEPGAKFTPVQGDEGYTVRAEFYNFLALHGSYDTSGAPIMNEYALNKTVNRQCFENICLDYHKKAAEGLKVRPAPLGYIYRELYYRQEATQPAVVAVNANIAIHPWEASALISSDQEQEIGAAIYENFVEVPDVQVILSVRMPDDTWVDYGPQSTDENGQTIFHLPPIKAPNSTIILYQVCLYGIEEAKNFCVMEEFTIWGNP
jgi:hypothetical protein